MPTAELPKEGESGAHFGLDRGLLPEERQGTHFHPGCKEPHFCAGGTRVELNQTDSGRVNKCDSPGEICLSTCYSWFQLDGVSGNMQN